MSTWNEILGEENESGIDWFTTFGSNYKCNVVWPDAALFKSHTYRTLCVVNMFDACDLKVWWSLNKVQKKRIKKWTFNLLSRNGFVIHFWIIEQSYDSKKHYED